MSIDVSRRWALPADVSAPEPGSGPPTVLADLPRTTIPGWPAPPPAWDGPPPSWWRPAPTGPLPPASAMDRLTGADPGNYLGSLAGSDPRRLPWADIRHRTFVAVVLALVLAALYGLQSALWKHAAPPHTGLAAVWSWASLLWVTALVPAAAGLAGLLAYRHPRNLHLTMPVDIPVCFRVVSRGRNTEALRSTIMAIDMEMTATPLFPYTIEVVTDQALAYMPPPGRGLTYIQVPRGYRTPAGSLFKARALHYALQVSDISPETWIVHCDEESQPTRSAIQGIAQLIREETASGRLRIGQGAITYHRNWKAHPFLTLADSSRTGDDFGRYRLAMATGLPLFGLHGSWIVVRNDIEKAAGFDVGPAGSLAEDSWWGLLEAQAGNRTRWVDGYMSEQCPDNVRDFMRQRRRWRNGMWQAVLRAPARLRYRAVMGISIICWMLAPVAWIYTLTHFGLGGYINPWVRLFANISFAVYIVITLTGLRVNMTEHGITNPARRAGLTALWLVMMPLFGLMESAAVLYATVRPAKTFDVVSK
jgi:beta-1,4-mannosyltransferase